MTCRLAILGNSHAACMIQALKDRPAMLGKAVSPVFFAAVGKSMRDLRPVGQRLVPGTDALRDQILLSARGREHLDIAAFDAFVLVGLGFHFPRLARHHSQAVADCVLHHSVRRGVLWQLAADLRRMTSARIACLHTPLPTTPADQSLPLAYGDLLARVRHAAAVPGVEILEQPARTRDDATLTTRERFSKGSRRLVKDRPHAEDDSVHMNAEYGAIVLQHIADGLHAPCGA